MRRLLDGESVEVGAERPAELPFHRPVPIWLAAGGPRTLEMGGRAADGVFIRVGVHPSLIEAAAARVRRGAQSAGRAPEDVRLGAIFHTVLADDREDALTMAKAMAAGYYEYSPMLFDPPGLVWGGPAPEALKATHGIWPDFHHDPDLLKAGRAAAFLSEAHAGAFALRGGIDAVAEQLLGVLRRSAAAGIEFEHVVLHPIPNPPSPDAAPDSFTERVARELLPRIRAALA